ncbi:hypothetical protein ACJX0J_016735, partial [Zea mays]
MPLEPHVKLDEANNHNFAFQTVYGTKGNIISWGKHAIYVDDTDHFHGLGIIVNLEVLIELDGELVFSFILCADFVKGLGQIDGYMT